MDFNVRRKQQSNLKPISRKQNYLSNIRADSPNQRDRYTLTSGNIQIAVGNQGATFNNAYFAHQKEEESN